MPLVGPPVQHHLDPADLLGVGLKSAPDDVALFSLCAVSAPSSLAVEAADRLGQTVVGFLRGERFNVYTHPERIDLES